METPIQSNRSVRILKISLTLLTLFTAINHIFIGSNVLEDSNQTILGILFVLNGLGFFILLTGIFTKYVPILSSNKVLSHYLMIIYTIITIVAYVLMSGILSGEAPTPIAIMTKVAEFIIIVVTFLHLSITYNSRGSNG